MIDSKFKQLLDRLHKANVKYKSLLREAEEEYRRRFGNYPSDVDDDFWIDSFKEGETKATLKEVTESAESHY